MERQGVSEDSLEVSIVCDYEFTRIVHIGNHIRCADVRSINNDISDWKVKIVEIAGNVSDVGIRPLVAYVKSTLMFIKDKSHFVYFFKTHLGIEHSIKGSNR